MRGLLQKLSSRGQRITLIPTNNRTCHHFESLIEHGAKHALLLRDQSTSVIDVLTQSSILGGYHPPRSSAYQPKQGGCDITVRTGWYCQHLMILKNKHTSSSNQLPYNDKEPQETLPISTSLLNSIRKGLLNYSNGSYKLNDGTSKHGLFKLKPHSNLSNNLHDITRK